MNRDELMAAICGCIREDAGRVWLDVDMAGLKLDRYMSAQIEQPEFALVKALAQAYAQGYTSEATGIAKALQRENRRLERENAMLRNSLNDIASRAHAMSAQTAGA